MACGSSAEAGRVVSCGGSDGSGWWQQRRRLWLRRQRQQDHQPACSTRRPGCARAPASVEERRRQQLQEQPAAAPAPAHVPLVLSPSRVQHAHGHLLYPPHPVARVLQPVVEALLLDVGRHPVGLLVVGQQLRQTTRRVKRVKSPAVTFGLTPATCTVRKGTAVKTSPCDGAWPAGSRDRRLPWR